MTPLDSLTAQGRVYHLAGITLIDENRALCMRRLWLFCADLPLW